MIAVYIYSDSTAVATMSAAARNKWLAFRYLHGKHARTSANNIHPLYVSHIALCGLSFACVILCALNDAPIRPNPALQVIAHASFIIAAACMYILFKVVNFALRMVLSCVEQRYQNVSEGYGSDVEDELIANDEEAADSDAWTATAETEQIEHVPREAIVASMYMGGMGSFLAVAPLCMWYPPSTMAFCVALTLIAIHEEKKIVCIIVCIGLTIGLCSWLEVAKKQVAEGPEMWTQIVVGASSPFFIWASTGAVGASAFYHRLSASQTLETSLPVSLVLAILVLCWYSPVEEMISFSMFRTWRLACMMVLVPPYLSATLALLLHAFRTRKIAVAALVLTFILSARLSVSSTGTFALIDIVTPLPALFCIIGVMISSGAKQAIAVQTPLASSVELDGHAEQLSSESR
jgi:hypothetical protein